MFRDYSPYDGTPSSAALRNGFRYESYVVLELILRLVYVEGREITLALEQTPLHPFDDIVLELENQVFAIQVKRNKAGLPEDLQRRLGKASRSSSGVGALQRVIATHLSSSDYGAHEVSWHDLTRINLDSEILSGLGLSAALQGTFLLKLPTESSMLRAQVDLLKQVHGVIAPNIHQRAVDEIEEAFRAGSGALRVIDTARALEILGMAKATVRHEVHDLGSLIERTAVQESVVTALGEDKNVLLLGQPGSGKSAVLDLLQNREGDFPQRVRISCFISPEDSHYDSRLKLPFMLEELVSSGRKYRSTLTSVISERDVITRFKSESGPVWILVDGLDHVTRGNKGELSSFGRLLKALSLLPSVRLLVSAQTADQVPLQLRDSHFMQIEVPPLTYEEAKAIIRRLTRKRIRWSVSELLFDKSSGNPLILTYLIYFVEDVLKSEYRAKERLRGLPRILNLMDYLQRLLEGLEAEQQAALRAVAELRYGFDRATFLETLTGLGVPTTEALGIWTVISHIFKRVGPSRYLAWHYSLPHVLESLGFHLQDLIAPLAKVASSYSTPLDRHIYAAYFGILTDNSPEQFAEALQSAVLSAQVPPDTANQILMEGCRRAASTGNASRFALLDRCRTPAQAISLDRAEDVDPEQCIVFAASSEHRPTLLHPDVAGGIFSRLNHTALLLARFKSSPELDWVTTHHSSRSFDGFVGALAKSVFLDDLPASQALQEIATSTWWQRDHQGNREVPANARQNTVNRQFAALQLGRILALNSPSIELSAYLDFRTRTNAQALLRRSFLLGMTQITLGRGDTFLVEEAAREIQAHPKTLEQGWYQVLYLSEPPSNELQQALRETSLADSIKAYLGRMSRSELGIRSELRAILSKFALLSAIDEVAFTEALGAITFTNVRYHKATYDFINQYVRGWHADRESIASLEQLFSGGPSLRGFDRYEYYRELSLCVKTALDIGLIQGRDKPTVLKLYEMSKKGGQAEPWSILFSRPDLEKYLPTINALTRERSSWRESEPYEWQGESARIALAYSLAGQEAKALPLALESYGLRALYGSRNDPTYHAALYLCKLTAHYGDHDAARTGLQELAPHLITIDRITHGKGTKHWFAQLMNFAYEPSHPDDSLLLEYIGRQIVREKGDGYWLWRTGPFFKAQITNVSMNLYNEWVGLAVACFFDGTPGQSGSQRTDLSYLTWMLNSIRADKCWKRGKTGRDVTAIVKKWARIQLKRYAQEIAHERDSRGHDLASDFKDMITAAELLLGIEPSFKYTDSAMSSPMDRSASVKPLTVTQLKQANLPSTIEQSRFLKPAWIGGEDLHRDQVLTALAAMGQEGLKLLLTSAISELEEEWHFLPNISASVGRLLGRLGMHEELGAWRTESIGTVAALLPNLSPDSEFAWALSNVQFHSLGEVDD